MENINELSLEEIEDVSGGIGSDSGRVEADGTVLVNCGPDTFTVDIGGQTVTAYRSGKLRMNYIVPRPGDRVRVEYSPENLRGRIVYRYR